MIAVRWRTPYSPLLSLFHYTRDGRLTLCGRTIWADSEAYSPPSGVRFCKRCSDAESLAHALPDSFESDNAKAVWTDAIRNMLAKCEEAK